MVARLGGDEFIILLPKIKNQHEIYQVAERILLAFRNNLPFSRDFTPLSASIGISLYPQDTKDTYTLIQLADRAMYAAKLNGRACIHFSHECTRTTTKTRDYPSSVHTRIMLDNTK